MRLNSRARRQRHRLANVTVLKQPSFAFDIESDFPLLPEWNQKWKPKPYQLATLEALRSDMVRAFSVMRNPSIRARALTASPTIMALGVDWMSDSLREFQSQPRGNRVVKPLIIRPLSTEDLDRILAAKKDRLK